jgi:hypothetical protein
MGSLLTGISVEGALTSSLVAYIGYVGALFLFFLRSHTSSILAYVETKVLTNTQQLSEADCQYTYDLIAVSESFVAKTWGYPRF